MRRWLPLSAAVVAAALTFADVSEATTVVPVSLTELTRGSDDIVVGTVRRSTSRWDGGFIVTDHEVEVVTALRGRLPQRSTIVVRVAGGVVGRVAQYVPDAPALEVSRSYMLFLSGGISNLRYLAHMTAAAVPVALDGPSGRVQATVPETLVMTDAAAGPALTAPRRAGPARAVVELDALVRAVRAVAP